MVKGSLIIAFDAKNHAFAVNRKLMKWMTIDVTY
jgi:hypothetical protein